MWGFNFCTQNSLIRPRPCVRIRDKKQHHKFLMSVSHSTDKTKASLKMHVTCASLEQLLPSQHLFQWSQDIVTALCRCWGAQLRRKKLWWLSPNILHFQMDVYRTVTACVLVLLHVWNLHSFSSFLGQLEQEQVEEEESDSDLVCRWPVVSAGRCCCICCREPLAKALSSGRGRLTTRQISARFEILCLSNISGHCITFKLSLMKHKINIKGAYTTQDISRLGTSVPQLSLHSF